MTQPGLFEDIDMPFNLFGEEAVDGAKAQADIDMAAGRKLAEGEKDARCPGCGAKRRHWSGKGPMGWHRVGCNDARATEELRRAAQFDEEWAK